MKILVIGDSHFKNDNELETTQMCDKIYEIVLRENPDYIVSLGDVLNDHSRISMGPFNRAMTFLYKLSNMCKCLYIIIGNHDRVSNQVWTGDTNSPFVACKQWRNTVVVDSVFVDKENSMIFVPYVPVGRFMEALATASITDENITDFKVVFAHQEFRGAQMGAIISANGDEWKPEFPLCISGHIHDNQKLQHNLIYPGTPYQVSYGSSNPKGVMLLDLETLEYNYIDLGLPKKLIVHLSPEELTTYQPPENAFIKIVCKGDTKAIKEILKLSNVEEMLKNPRIKLSIQEDRKHRQNKPLEMAVKTDTVNFQKRLTDAVGSSGPELQTLFKSIFGEINT
jgi:DNA repair exonuclease SbcCD nuclease subunit